MDKELAEKQAQAINLMLIELGGISQKTFADVVGVSAVTVSRWAKGHVAISDKSARAISQKVYEKYGKYYDPLYIIGFADSFNDFLIRKGEEIRHKKEVLLDVIKLGFHGEVEAREINAYDDSRQEYVQRAFCFSDDGKKLSLTDKELEKFEDEMLRYVDMRLTAMLERGEW